MKLKSFIIFLVFLYLPSYSWCQSSSTSLKISNKSKNNYSIRAKIVSISGPYNVFLDRGSYSFVNLDSFQLAPRFYGSGFLGLRDFWHNHFDSTVAQEGDFKPRKKIEVIVKVSYFDADSQYYGEREYRKSVKVGKTGELKLTQKPPSKKPIFRIKVTNKYNSEIYLAEKPSSPDHERRVLPHKFGYVYQQTFWVFAPIIHVDGIKRWHWVKIIADDKNMSLKESHLTKYLAKKGKGTIYNSSGMNVKVSYRDINDSTGKSSFWLGEEKRVPQSQNKQLYFFPEDYIIFEVEYFSFRVDSNNHRADSTDIFVGRKEYFLDVDGERPWILVIPAK